MLTSDSIKSLFTGKLTRPVTFKEIAERFGLVPAQRKKLKRLLREMVRDGAIVRTRKGLYGPPSEMSLVTGSYEAHRDGYGFVIPDKPGERDIFVPVRASMGAMDSDRVIVRVDHVRQRQGSIVRILERAHTRVAGTFESGRVGHFVRPVNQSLSFDIAVPLPRGGLVRDGDRVIVEIEDYPTGSRPASGRVIKVLQTPEKPLDDIEALIEELDLPRKFPHRVTEEARAIKAVNFQLTGRTTRRTDLRDRPTVTIDGEKARDFDDAVSVEKTDLGYRLWVHIADVAHYVPWESALDEEAYRRGTSVYFPHRAIPMLPRELSEDLCSLVPHAERRTVTVEMDFDGKGERAAVRFYPSVIRSDQRLTYTSVSKLVLHNDRAEQRKYAALLPLLTAMRELCDLLKERRLSRGSLDFDLPEPEVILDLQGNPEAIVTAERSLAHMIIEEFMIAANEAVAEHLEGRHLPCIYRIHEEPDPMRIEEVSRLVRTLSAAKGRKRPSGTDIPSMMKTIRGTTYEQVIHSVILRSLKQARYSPQNVGHYGLASDCYTHFTSPIRRYPDLVVHRILKDLLLKGGLSDRRLRALESFLPDCALQTSRLERLADRAERTALDAMRAWFIKDKVGEGYKGTVTSVTPYGLKVRLKDYFIEGFIHVSFMTDVFYRFSDDDYTLRGTNTGRRFSIGDEVLVRIISVDTGRREIVLSL
jgi:ribonuclease R